MLHGIIRAATAALVFVIAILIYTNYVRNNDSVLPDHSDVASAPEVPQVPVSPDSGSPAPAPLAAPIADVVNVPTARDTNPQNIATEIVKPVPAPRRPRVDIVDDGAIAEVVELPPSNRPRADSVAQSPKASGKHTHIVQPGESLWVISRKYLGNGELNAKIAEANGLTSRDHIHAGQLLIIPDLNNSAVARVPVEAVHVSEDLADDDDARHFMKTAQTPNATRGPAIMSSTVQNKF